MFRKLCNFVLDILRRLRGKPAMKIIPATSMPVKKTTEAREWSGAYIGQGSKQSARTERPEAEGRPSRRKRVIGGRVYKVRKSR